MTPEPTDVPDRLRFLRPVPISISTTVGDVLSNLRAALESLAFEVARRTQGGQLTPAQEQASTFPIKATPDEFDSFIEADAARGAENGCC